MTGVGGGRRHWWKKRFWKQALGALWILDLILEVTGGFWKIFAGWAWSGTRYRPWVWTINDPTQKATHYKGAMPAQWTLLPQETYMQVSESWDVSFMPTGLCGFWAPFIPGLLKLGLIKSNRCSTSLFNEWMILPSGRQGTKRHLSFVWFISDFLILEDHYSFQSVQLLSHVRLFATPWNGARQDSLSITSS